ncbi:MAG: sigma-54-dependent Fis family transcriptional regulator [Alphaproteobacteria bacterium]|nr:sigma-54-dependent Fis family transcriptional regulator [Alphaproteobacteria bacterium]NDG04198.1 sigma-54-dependent Fis family transcriptional regulator [Alphaproteobacteria bacterium]
MSSETILIAEDEPLQREMLKVLLQKKMGFNVVEASDDDEAVAAVERSHPEDIAAVILDVFMPRMNGLEALSAIKNLRSSLPVLVLTASDDMSHAVQAMKLGAADYIPKPLNPDVLSLSLENALRYARMANDLAKIKRDQAGALSFADLIGHNSGLRTAVAIGKKAALTEAPVLLQGETGTGKELFARAIHGEGRRAGAPFIAVNCGAIPANLVESTLFGHEKGSFTGAIQRTLGKFREAEGGTLFLDEIAELSADAQVKILRALQQKEIEPVGAARPVKVNVRILAATHKNLAHEVTAGALREDLFFRLNVLPITLPPLRERGDDVPMMAQHFLSHYAALDMATTKKLSPDAQHYLRAHHWPGNVRELENLMRRALVLSDQNVLTAAILQDLQQGFSTEAPVRTVAETRHITLRKDDGTPKTMDEIEQEAMALTLEDCAGNVTKAADNLGMAKSTFYRKMDEKKKQ